MHFPRSVNKAVRRPRSLERSIGTRARSAVRSAVTRRTAPVESTGLPWPTTTPVGVDHDLDVTNASPPDYWAVVVAHLKKEWSPEQISGWLRRKRRLSISHETIYRYIWEDRRRGGALYQHLRGSQKQRRKRYGRYDSRSRLAGKRLISERPAAAHNRSRVGHLEADTVIGNLSDKHCVLTLVDRKTGYVMIGKLEARTVEATNRRAVRLINDAARHTHTVTADNGTEFHGYDEIEAATGSVFYFATPYHSWERGTSENTNGLIRQYLPKRQSMVRITQRHCSRIAQKLNNRPRKRLGFLTPKECYENSSIT